MQYAVIDNNMDHPQLPHHEGMLAGLWSQAYPGLPHPLPALADDAESNALLQSSWTALGFLVRA